MYASGSFIQISDISCPNLVLHWSDRVIQDPIHTSRKALNGPLVFIWLV